MAKPKGSAFGRKIQRLRESRGLSRPQLAEATGLTRVCVWKLETDGGGPDLKTFFTLARFFRVDPVKLYRLVGR